MTSNAYRRLPGSLRGFLRRNAAWAGDDHVLLISGTRFHERYHRVDYRDVLAVVIERARRFTAPWYGFVAVFMLLIAGFISVSVRTSPALLSPLFFTAAALIVASSVMLALFSSCRVWIATAVGNVAVPGVARIWQAKIFVKKLQSRVPFSRETGRP